MAWFTVTVTVTVTVLLFTLALSVASNKAENDIISENLASLSAEPDPDSTNTILPGSDEVTLPVNFHPINRHFPRRPLTTTAPLNRRPWGRGLKISYVNDMIYSGEEEKATGIDLWSDSVVSDDIPAIKILIGPFPTEKEDGSNKITVKLVNRKEGEEDEREYYKVYNGMFTRNIRKFLDHLV